MAIGGKAGAVFTEINVTPLTDVFLVLLVIMILIAPQANQTVLKVEPPSGPSSVPQAKQDAKISVDVLSSGVVKVNDHSMNAPDAATIAAAIKAEYDKIGKPDVQLNLSSDADALQKYVVGVMDAAAGCGIKNLRVMPLKNI